MIYAANARVETIALLLARKELPAVRHVWDRHLAVYLHAAIEAYPHLTGRLIRESMRLKATGSQVVDTERIKKAQKAYKVGVAQIPKEFSETLDRVRNTVGAHHLTSPHNGIDGLIESVRAQTEPVPSAFDDLITNGFVWSMRALTCGQESLAALNWQALPPLPESDEYLRLEAELDARISANVSRGSPGHE